MTTSFASGTTVSAEKTRQEIETLLGRRGAQQFGCFTDYERGRAMIGFRLNNLNIQMEVLIPKPDETRFTVGKFYRTNSPERARNLHESEVRRRWRCLLLSLKAKMVAVSDGVTTFEKEFLPYVVMGNGQTVGDALAPAIEAGKSSGIVPAGLLLGDGRTT